MRYKLTDISDSTISLELSGNSLTTTKAEMMGNETTTTLNNKFSGKILIDKVTGLLKEKNTVIESSGTTEAMGNSLPVTSKTTIEVKVF